MSDAFGQGATALAGDFDEAGIAGDLVEERQGALGFREHTFAQVIFKLQKGVVDAEAVVFDAALQEFDEFLLAREAFANLQELRGSVVQRVVEFDLVCLPSRVPAKGFLTQICDLSMDVEIHPPEMVEFGNKLENFAS